MASFDAGIFNSVPLLLGTNRNENSLWICPQYGNISHFEYDALIIKTFGWILGYQILDLYPVSNYDTPAQAAVAVMSDYTFMYQITCNISNLLVVHQEEPQEQFHNGMFQSTCIFHSSFHEGLQRYIRIQSRPRLF
jgi:hypothetical protein